MGTEVVYYDDWGRREAKYTNTTMDLGGVTVNRSTLTLLEDNGRWISNVDLNERTGNKDGKTKVQRVCWEIWNSTRKNCKKKI